MSLLPLRGQAQEMSAQQSEAQPTVSSGDWQQWGMTADGKGFRNPVIPADYSDLDCIRVGKDYYAISSTMQFSPGMTILHSRDLVNWEIAGHAVGDLTQISTAMSWQQMAAALTVAVPAW